MKKGFTLIEIISVIVVLSVLLLILIPTVGNILEKNRGNIYEETEKRLKKAAEKYVITTGISIPNNASIIITQEDLVNQELIKEIVDLEDKSNLCESYVLVRKIDEKNEFIPYLNCTNYTSKTTIESNLIIDMPLGDKIEGNNYINRASLISGVNTSTTSITNRFSELYQATNFNGISYITLGQSNQIIQNAPFSISMWFNTNFVGPGDNDNRLITFQRSTGASTGYSITLGQSNNLRILYSDQGSIHRYLSTPIELNTWYNVVTTYDGITHKLYLNGELKNSVIDTLQNISTGTAYIGMFTPNQYIYSGYLDDLKVYERVLTEKDVLHNYNVESKISY